MVNLIPPRGIEGVCMDKAVVLLSGGLDSTVAFKEAFDRCERLVALTFDYGQMAGRREVESAASICSRYNVPHRVLHLPWLRGGALTGQGELPTPEVEELEIPQVAMETARRVWVPARNLVFLAIAASIAEGLEYNLIVTGFDAEEAETFPDNSARFVQLFNETLKLGTLNHPRVWAPLENLDKTGIVRRGVEINAPLELSWSCYRPDPQPCGACESCQRRKRAFQRAGVPDPQV